MQLNIEIFSELPDFSSSRAKWDMQTSSFTDQMEIQEPRILTWKVKLTMCLFRCKNYETVITKLFQIIIKIFQTNLSEEEQGQAGIQ